MENAAEAQQKVSTVADPVENVGEAQGPVQATATVQQAEPVEEHRMREQEPNTRADTGEGAAPKTAAVAPAAQVETQRMGAEAEPESRQSPVLPHLGLGILNFPGVFS